MTIPATPPAQDPNATDPAQGTGQPNGTPAEGQQPEDNSGQAPYAQYLAELPESVRPLVEPAFKTWDADVTQKFQKLHSDYEPWKEVTENYDPEDVQGALQVALTLQNDPQRFLTALKDAFPELVQEIFGGQSQQPANPASNEQGLGDLDPEDPVTKRLEALQQQVEQLTGNLTEREQFELEQSNQQQLDAILADMHAKHGNFDDTFVLSQMAYRQATPDQAIAAWNETLKQYGNSQTQTPAPTVLSPGGGLPASDMDVTKLDSNGTQALVAQILAEANKTAN